MDSKFHLTLLGVWLLIHVWIKVNPSLVKRAPGLPCSIDQVLKWQSFVVNRNRNTMLLVIMIFLIYIHSRLRTITGFLYPSSLTHWGRVMHICVTKLTIIDSNNGLSPGRRQAIIWTNDGILLIWPSGTNFSEMLSEIHIFSFKKMHLKMSSGYRRPFCLGLNVLNRK